MTTTADRRPGGRLSPLALAVLVVALLLGSTGGAVAHGIITGAKIKDGTVTGADIKNESLTAKDVRDEPRAWGAAYTTYIDDFVTATYQPIVSRSFNTAAKGFLAITATVYAEDDVSLAGDGRLQYSLRIDGKVLAGYRQLHYKGSGAGENGAVTIVVPVQKGSHSVALVAREIGTGSFITNSSLSIVYTPTGGATGVSLSKTVVPRANR
ncbi:hypothetical protein [Nocardioides sp. J54]|uniref:hypothetical protein n=1 Tax=Nocardioides sp. J54 TaxID=935866 RepID=UPI00048BBA5F|nr:hypothetical protein [Nocardioides sp. J54]